MSTEDEDDALVSEMAQKIRGLYWLNYRLYLSRVTGTDPGPQERRTPRWDGGTDRLGKRHLPYWPKLARHYLENNIEPAAAISTTFSAWVGNRPPRPDQLIRVLQRGGASAAAKDNIKFKFLSEQDVASTEIALLGRTNLSPTEIRRRVITSSVLTLSPLFRMCLAYDAKMLDLSQYYEERALRQYITQAAAYDAVMGPFIPADFRAKAQAQLNRLSQNNQLFMSPKR